MEVDEFCKLDSTTVAADLSHEFLGCDGQAVAHSGVSLNLISIA
jgi:hypothetical protein